MLHTNMYGYVYNIYIPCYFIFSFFLKGQIGVYYDIMVNHNIKVSGLVLLCEDSFQEISYEEWTWYIFLLFSLLKQIVFSWPFLCSWRINLWKNCHVMQKLPTCLSGRLTSWILHSLPLFGCSRLSCWVPWPRSLCPQGKLLSHLLGFTGCLWEIACPFRSENQWNEDTLNALERFHLK